MTKNRFFNGYLSFLLTLAIFYSLNSIAQINAADADSTFGIGAFDNVVNTTTLQQDGKILVGGYFINYKNTPVNYLARLNTNGTLDSTFTTGTGPNANVTSITIQPDGKILITGQFTSFNGHVAPGFARLTRNGLFDTSFLMGSGPQGGSIANCAIQPNGKIVIGGYFTSYNGTSSPGLARLNSNGSFDNSFNVGSGSNGVTEIVIQTDNKIVIAGVFSSYNGTSLNRIARVNTDGSLDNSFSIGTGFNGIIFTIALQGDGKIIAAGSFSSYNGAATSRIIRLNTNGSKDNTFIGSTNNIISAVAIQPNGAILIGGDFTLTTNGALNRIARLNSDGTSDLTFNPGTGTINNDVSTASVLSINVQTDGKIILGGWFTAINGCANDRIARLNGDGTIDHSFNGSKGGDDLLYTMAIQPDGKLLIGGKFKNYGGTSKSYFARLNVDGTLDNSITSVGPNSYVLATLVQPDGKIILTGYFTTYNGVARRGIARINNDGTLDNSFNPGTGIWTGYATTLAYQSDGKILIGGTLDDYNGGSAYRITRINSDGSIDPSFTQGSCLITSVNSIVVQPDGKILVAGQFSKYNGVTVHNLVRLNPDGTLDNTFDVSQGSNAIIYSCLLLPNNKIILGGSIQFFGALSKNKIVQLNPDGTLDNTFNTQGGPNNTVYAIARQPNGQLIIGGAFSSVNSVAMKGVARLDSLGNTDLSFNAGIGVNYPVTDVAIQTDGKIFIAGSFTKYKNASYNYLARLYGVTPKLPKYTLNGTVFMDTNSDCIPQGTEKKIPSIIVKASPGNYYGSSDINGLYKISIDTGNASYTTFTLNQLYNSIYTKTLSPQCSPSKTVTLNAFSSTDTCCINFADTIKNCTLLNISIKKTLMRRCRRSTTYVDYYNYGLADAQNAQIKITYPSYIVPINSTPMWTSKQGNVVTYDAGTVPANSYSKITIVDSVVCGNESIRGLTQCIKASITPTNTCEIENPLWDNSSIVVTGTCISDSVSYSIQNKGTGDMSASRAFRLYVNDTLAYTGNFQLNSNESLLVKYPGEGNTIRLEADQDQFHPGKSRPRAILENCGIATPGAEMRGLVATVPQDDEDEETATTCAIITDSYDPNLKQTVPAGIGATNQVEPGQELEYVVHFQNTGNDFAYKVVVVDTLDASFDASSFMDGVSSHPYKLSISGKNNPVLTYTFDDIYLPDSTTDKIGSNGLLSFKIKIPDNAALGSVFKNKAYIYFDYNSPIITNETMHAVGTTVQQDLTKGSKISIQTVATTIQNSSSEIFKIYPNPTSDFVRIETPLQGNQMEMHLLTLMGSTVKKIKLSNTNDHLVDISSISAGMYLYEFWQNGERKKSGLLQIK